MSIAQNLTTIQSQITKTATAHNIDPAAITLIAVSKKQPAERLHEALTAGQTIFGENRVQEAQTHWQEIKSEGKYGRLTLHLIGPLQTNKVKDAVKLFDVIHTLDREKLARALSKEMQTQNRNLPCFIQINTGNEDQKSGLPAKDLKDFLSFCKTECALDITGLMCIPPIDEPPALHFALLKKLAEQNNLKNLSMGMSSDFQKAIPLTIQGGKTVIRVGTGIFGSRMI